MFDQDAKTGCGETTDVAQKRKNENRDDDVDEEIENKVKRLKMLSPKNGVVKRRTSLSSLESNDSNVSFKQNFKTFIGELVNKNMISINNENFYLFKFLFNNNSKEYYGASDQYYSMKLNHTYQVSLNYENKKIYIGTYKECKVKETLVSTKSWLTNEDFDGGDTVSVYAKLKYGFKILDNVDSYKMVFHVNMGDVDTLKEIECTANLKKICNAANGAVTVMSNEDVLLFFNSNKDKVVLLKRIKCHFTNGGYKSLMILPITQICVENDDKIKINASENNDVTQNVSRLNKIILTGQVKTINAEIANDERLVVEYQMKNFNEQIKACLFSKHNFGKNSNKINKNLQQLETDINQLNELIENDLIEVQVFVAYDLERKIYTILGITKYEIDSETYDSL
ncbi:lef3 [Euproctis pseudoconspersa nucleopolyhedrovirus]|uniref:Lef3 n=1 Tax=Euproctis pseudoconspersa nucleopolyhedrovirus TaxID=307467 RepID=C3TWX2_9ABAC|nr:lef3 [Euproctis pseudoconspersa nucleopolyhedrovirus]ACO53514.1 lef3 [Euproctis pseudoconspersa nucleopolyhedrovirus]QUJ09254.1 lef3 protein [Gynaephora ruoergensis nucleopolyhedrovirus]